MTLFKPRIPKGIRGSIFLWLFLLLAQEAV